MDAMDLSSSITATHARRLLAGFACVLTLLWMGLAGLANAQSDQPLNGSTSLDSASLVQCLSASEPAERSATFAGEMAMIPGATRMSMRIELLERMPGESGYHPVLAPGVGVWRTADTGVRSYRHLEQVTNLSAPAAYRALITFRWQGPHGRVLRHDERRTQHCWQPAPAPPAPASPLE